MSVAAWSTLTCGLQLASADDNLTITPPRNGMAFQKLVGKEYSALKAQGIPPGTTRQQQVKAELEEAAGLESKGFDDPKDEARDLALIRHAADLDDTDAHNVLLALEKFSHVPCRKHSPSGC